MRYELVCFSEIDKYAIKSFCAIHNEDENKNIGNIETACKDDLRSFNFMVGGTPCQDFSIGGKRKSAVYTCNECGLQYEPLLISESLRNKCPLCGSENINKTRSSLLVEWLRILKEMQPKAAIYENVKNITSFKSVFNPFLDEIERYGYNTYFKVLNSKDFGIPQNRERLILVIIRKDIDNGEFIFPNGFELQTQITDLLDSNAVRKYIETSIPGIYIDESIKPSVRKEFEKDIGNIVGCQRDMYQCRCNKGFQDCKVGIKVAPTIRAGNPHTAVFDGKHIIKLTARETFRFMGFADDDFDKCVSAGVSNAQLYKQAGNSIVVAVIFYVLAALLNAIPELFENVKLGSFCSGIGAFEKAMEQLAGRESYGEEST